MTVKQLLQLLKTDYIELASQNDPYSSLEYLRKDELNTHPEFLNYNVTEIEPLGTLKKKLFDSSAGDSDYVAAIKILYGDNIETEEETYTSFEDDQKVYQEEDYSQFGYGSQDYNSRPNNPFGYNFDDISKIPMPDKDQMAEIINSDAFQEFIKSGVMDEFMPPGLAEISKHLNIGEMMKRMYPLNNDDYDVDDDYDDIDDE